MHRLARSNVFAPPLYRVQGYAPPTGQEVRCYCRKRKQKALIRQAPSFSEEPAENEDNQLYCSNCAHPITAEENAISVSGSYHHAFFNPAGITYEVRCFQLAPGVTPYLFPSNEFSWFAGYSWQIVHCSACQAHLGWRYIQDAGSHIFFGLIASKLQKKQNLR
ncbi:hypothetical protein JWJ90_18565 [Desulfobulbus rhabdoformis]|jgi:hypothetical protein|nr:hypothetical protein [Desulfobulbus rhabdoformis]